MGSHYGLVEAAAIRHIQYIGIVYFNPTRAEPGYVLPEEANWSGSALFAIKYVNLYQQSGASNLIGWKLEMGVAS